MHIICDLAQHCFLILVEADVRMLWVKEGRIRTGDTKNGNSSRQLAGKEERGNGRFLFCLIKEISMCIIIG